VLLVVLEIPDISPLNRRNKIVAGKSGSFPGAKAHLIEDEHEDEDDSQKTPPIETRTIPTFVAPSWT
jgi:hypothetical protein